MWKLLIDKEEVEEFYRSFPEKEKETASINVAYKQIGESFYQSKIPANLIYYRNTETNQLHCKSYLLDNILHDLPENLESLKKEGHYLFASFGLLEGKVYVRFKNLPTFIENLEEN